VIHRRKLVTDGRNSNKPNSRRRKKGTRPEKKSEIENRQRSEHRRGRKLTAKKKQPARKKTKQKAGEGRSRRSRSRARWCGGMTASSLHHHHCLATLWRKKFGFEGDGSYLKVVERGRRKVFLERETVFVLNCCWINTQN
jgi:hypothetical protein